MCGGRGKRLGMGEKPMIRVAGKCLIDYVLDELWFCEVYCATTKFTPKTESYLKSQGVSVVRTSGRGFVDDYIEAIFSIGAFEPILIVSADLVVLEEGLLLRVAEKYFEVDATALKVVDGRKIPVGINIVDGYFYDVPQDEVEFVTDKVININTPKDLMKALCSISKRKGGE